MKLRFNRNSRLAALTLVAGGFILPGLSVQTAFAAPPAAKNKMEGGRHQAGEGRRGGRGGRMMMERMKADLKLTDGQMAKIKSIFKANADQRRALRGNTSLTPDQRKTRMRQLRTERMKKMRAVLTPEQQRKWAQMMKQNRQNFRQNHGQGHGQGKPKTKA